MTLLTFHYPPTLCLPQRNPIPNSCPLVFWPPLSSVSAALMCVMGVALHQSLGNLPAATFLKESKEWFSLSQQLPAADRCSVCGGASRVSVPADTWVSSVLVLCKWPQLWVHDWDSHAISGRQHFTVPLLIFGLFEIRQQLIYNSSNEQKSYSIYHLKTELIKRSL